MCKTAQTKGNLLRLLRMISRSVSKKMWQTPHLTSGFAGGKARLVVVAVSVSVARAVPNLSGDLNVQADKIGQGHALEHE